MDGSQGILWTETDTGSRTYFGPRWTERDLANLPPPAPVGELLWRHPAPDASPVIPYRRELRDYAPSWEDQKRMMRQNDARFNRNAYEWTPNGMRPR